MKDNRWDIPGQIFNFPRDLAYGKQGEKLVGSFLDSLESRPFEVKSDRYRNGRMAVEIEQNPRRATDDDGNQIWVRSGLSVTKAHWWVYIYSQDDTHGAFMVVSVKRLKKYIRKNRKRMTLIDFAKRSDNPARGYLIEPLEVMDLMVNPEYDE